MNPAVRRVFAHFGSNNLGVRQVNGPRHLTPFA
jgi:hypothetical protein